MSVEATDDLNGDEAAGLEETEDGDLIELAPEDAVGEDEADSDDSDETGEDSAADDTKALDELEAEELEMLTDDESTETIVIDEAAEMRAIRRAELSMEGDSADEASSEEFVCTSCFLVKRTNQLANKRKKICLDCAG
ncbi:MAG: DUF4193 family protein [Acidimicrobiia bacterium]